MKIISIVLIDIFLYTNFYIYFFLCPIYLICTFVINEIEVFQILFLHVIVYTKSLLNIQLFLIHIKIILLETFPSNIMQKSK